MVGATLPTEGGDAPKLFATSWHLCLSQSLEFELELELEPPQQAQQSLTETPEPPPGITAAAAAPSAARVDVHCRGTAARASSMWALLPAANRIQ